MSTQAAPTTPSKSVIEVYSDTHERTKDAARKSGNSVKRFASLMLDYAIGKFESGEITLREPEVAEVAEGESSK